MIKPNLPDTPVKRCIVSKEITPKIEYNLESRNIKISKITGLIDCDNAVRNHPDLYVMHCDISKFFSPKNKCSFASDTIFDFEYIDINLPCGKILYPNDVFFNAVSVGKNIICCKKYVQSEILNYASMKNFRVINVNQGYTKCNICIVDENSVITEDVGIYNKLTKVGFNVLLLENKIVRLEGYKYGFIGGASGKIDSDKLAFFGNIKLHPEYDRIRHFLYKRDVQDVSLSDDPLTDYGSLIPVE